MEESSTQILSKFLYSLRFEDLPESSLNTIRQCTVDYFSSAWNSYGCQLYYKYVDYAVSLGAADRFPVIGGCRTSLFWSVFANAAISHIMEVDDIHRASTMHVGISVLPVVLGIAKERNLSGKEIVQSIACGYEASIRVGEFLGRGHYSIFHTTGTAGSFGAAAAAAKALGLDAEKTAHALGHAGTQANALWQFLDDGALAAKAFHPGRAAQNGLAAAYLAAQGIPGAIRILEGQRGYGSYATHTPNLEAVTANFGSPHKVEEICFKSYPTCGQTHSMLDALRDILAEHRLAASDVREVEARVYQQAINIAGITQPRTLEEAKFSLPTCLAVMLVMGDLTFSNMTWETVSLPAVREAAARVRLVFDPEIDAKFPATRPCRIIVRTRDGRELSRENYYRTGDPEKPMSPARMRDKFRDLTGHALSRDRQDMILDWCEALPDSVMTTDLFLKN